MSRIYLVYVTLIKKYLIEDTAHEIAKYFNIVSVSCHYYANDNKKYLNRYVITDTGKDKKKEVKYVKKKQIPLTQEEKIRNHLEHYGNCYMKEEPKKYKRKLKEMGYPFTYHLCSDGDGYVLERVY